MARCGQLAKPIDCKSITLSGKHRRCNSFPCHHFQWCHHRPIGRVNWLKISVVWVRIPLMVFFLETILCHSKYAINFDGELTPLEIKTFGKIRVIVSIFASIAQLAEHLFSAQMVVSSNLIACSIFCPVVYRSYTTLWKSEVWFDSKQDNHFLSKTWARTVNGNILKLYFRILGGEYPKVLDTSWL